MSYILDALRKSDQQRQRGTAPMTLAAPAVVEKRPAFSLNLVLALALLIAGMAIGWLRPWQPVAPNPPPLNQAKAPVPPLAAAPLSPLPPRVPARPSPQRVREAAVSETQAGVIALSELPAAIRQDIPSLSISLHGYASKPADRITMINDKLLRQGELLAPGLRLEQITADGVILDYKGYRFHHGVR